MAAPSQAFQDYAATHSVTYEAEVAYNGMQHWRWDASNLTIHEADAFANGSFVAGHISQDQILNYHPSNDVVGKVGTKLLIKTDA